MAYDDLEDLYKDTILDHCRDPHNREKLDAPDIEAKAVNPFCGDEIHIQIRIGEGQRVSEIGLQGVGCAINQATGSILSDALKGKTLDEVREVSSLFRDLMQGKGISVEQTKFLGELTVLEGVKQFPIRIKCTLLALSALEDAVDEYSRH